MLLFAIFEIVCFFRGKHEYPTGWKSSPEHHVRFKQCKICHKYLLNEHTVNLRNKALHDDFINHLIGRPERVEINFSRLPMLARMLS